MLRNSAAAHPDLSPLHSRGSPYQSQEQDHGHQPPSYHERNSSTISNSNSDSIAASPTATPPRRENAFSTPRPVLRPYQEYHSGFADDDLPSSPVSSRYSHRRQSSFSALLPLAIRNRTPSPTRKPSVAPVPEEEMPFTGDGRWPSRPGTAPSQISPRGAFAGWLSGTAAGNALESLSRPTTPRSPDPSTATPTTKLRRATPRAAGASGRRQVTPTDSVSAKASRFMSALSMRLAAAAAQATSATALDDDDELYNLNISAALFPPGGADEQGDAFSSPAAFKDLQANAAALLVRFQAAYRAKVLAQRDWEGERAAQRDELEEAVTRAAHLKLQLEGMARRAAEQELAVRQLVDELVAEKHAREEERLARRRAAAAAAGSTTPGSPVSEDQDLGVDERGWAERKRKSDGSASGSGESAWGETDVESVDDSVFSRCRSPAVTVATTVDGRASLVDLPMVVRSETGTVRIRNGVQLNALQKIFKGIAGDVEQQVDSCRNCEGRDASAAWETVSLLRDENKHLKQRLGQLEVAIEGALNTVNGLGL